MPQNPSPGPHGPLAAGPGLLEGPYSVSKAALGAVNQPQTTPGGTFIDRVRLLLERSAGADPAPKRATPGHLLWGETPNTSELAQISELERAALRARTDGGDDDAAAATASAPRQLLFSPPCAAARAAAVNAAEQPGSSGKRRHPGSASRLGRPAAAADAAVPSGAPNDEAVAARDDNNRPAAAEPAIKRPKVKGSSGDAEEQQQEQDERAVAPVLAVPEHLIAALADSDSDADDDAAGQQRPPPAAAATPPAAAATPPAAAATPPAAEPRPPPPLGLDAYLPPQACAAMAAAGAPTQLYPWQAECLSLPGVLQGRNLVYSASTSAGKTLVAEALMLRRLLSTSRPALLVLPFVSLCAEKAAALRRLLQPLGREVLDFYGAANAGAPAILAPSTGVVVATIEKANILVNRLLDSSTIGVLSCVVVDELHMAGADARGHLLELLLTKLRYAGALVFDSDDELSSNDAMGMEDGVQIVGMSATLPNAAQAATWLGAALYETDFRPVPLRQYVRDSNGAVLDENGEEVRRAVAPSGWPAADGDGVGWLAYEAVSHGHSALVFCGTRAACEQQARLMADTLPPTAEASRPWRPPADPGPALSGLRHPLTRAVISQALARLRPGYGGPSTLAAAAARGVAWHHAGLDSQERELVEAGFRCGAIAVLCATSTLAAGVNLPARRVIFKHAWIGVPSTGLIGATAYRQMAGRAGRAGIDSEGESYLVASHAFGAPRLLVLLRSTPAPLGTSLSAERGGMRRAMLEVVASGAVAAPHDAERYMKCTLAFATAGEAVAVADARGGLQWLGVHGFAFWDAVAGTFEATPFGRAALGSGLPPEVCLAVRNDLARARTSFVLTSELHLAFLCVPPTEMLDPEWQRLQATMLEGRGPAAAVATAVGVDRRFVASRARGMRGDGTEEERKEKQRVAARFWTAMALHAVLEEEESVAEVAQRCGAPRARVAALRDAACRFAGTVAVFCERLGWHDAELLISKFQKRVLHGVPPEVLALTEIDFVQAYTARQLYAAGLRCPEALAAMEDPGRVAMALAAGRPGLGAPEVQRLRQQAGRIVNAARRLVERRARAAREEAQAALQVALPPSEAERRYAGGGQEFQEPQHQQQYHVQGAWGGPQR